MFGQGLYHILFIPFPCADFGFWDSMVNFVFLLWKKSMNLTSLFVFILVATWKNNNNNNNNNNTNHPSTVRHSLAFSTVVVKGRRWQLTGVGSSECLGARLSPKISVFIFFGGGGKWLIGWNYPPPSNSHRQDYSIFSMESLKTFICDCSWARGVDLSYMKF